MLKGLTKIELTDIHTQKTETIVEENMVTNALSEILTPLGLASNSTQFYSTLTPYYKTLLGGILLLDSPVEEDPDNYILSPNVNPIGYGVYNTQNTYSSSLFGSYNTLESEFNTEERYVKYVYDFKTSEANGTISSIALTSNQGGYFSLGTPNVSYGTEHLLMTKLSDELSELLPYSKLKNEIEEKLFLIDPDQDIAYYYKKENDTQISILKKRAFLKSIAVFEQPNQELPILETITLSDLTLLNSLKGNYDPTDDCLYLISTSRSAGNYIKPEDRFVVIKIKLDTWEVTQYEMINTTTETFFNSASYELRYAYVHNGYVWLQRTTKYYSYYKFELGNSANVSKASNSLSTVTYPLFGIKDRIYYWDATSSLIINNQTNKMTFPKAKYVFNTTSSANSAIGIPFRNHPLIYYMGYSYSSSFYIYTYFFALGNYLATINNLSEPITKTADKTMKITYIIQEQ